MPRLTERTPRVRAWTPRASARLPRVRAPRMSRPMLWRALGTLIAAGIVTAGMLGTYSYGEAYWQHRGFAPVKRLAKARIGRLLTVHFYSRALRRRTDYVVYLPPGYSTHRRYPTYYLLHGAPGGPQDFISVVNLNVRLSNRLSEHQLRPMILVMPDGRINSTFSDSEWANTPTGAYESFVIDVVRDVDRRFSTVPSRRARVIAGYSAGAYGALNVALHHPDVFANVQSWSGYYVQTRKESRVFRHASAANLAYNSPLYFARTLRPVIARYPLWVYMFTGHKDPASRQIGLMARVLRRSGAVAAYNLYPGGHDWQVWYARVDPMMELATTMVSHPLPVVASGPSGTVSSRPSTAGSPRSQARGHAAARREAARAAGGPATVGRSGGAGGLGARAVFGLVLALVSAALINLGFLLQHRGLVRDCSGALRAWLAAVRSPTWLAGQALGWLGFGTQVLAVALAPLSLVQAFAAGGLALSVPLAAGLFGHRVPRAQVIAVAAIAASLAILPLGVPRPGPAMNAAAMITTTGALLVAATVISGRAQAVARALGAGLFYGVADAAIKAVSIGTRTHGAAGLVSGWTLLAVVGTFAGFLAFQAALREGNAVSSISLMTAVTTLVALVVGLVAFGESLGSVPAVTVLHLLAIAVVLGCVPWLAGDGQPRWRSPRVVVDRGRCSLVRIARGAGAGAGAVVAVAVAVLAGTGLLYALRGLGWLRPGPRAGDALPLLQLAGFDAQPLVRVAVAWLAAGVVLGLTLIRVSPGRRAVVAAGLGLWLVLFASEASFAVARNLRLSGVLASRVPGTGAWLEGLLLAAGAALPRPLRRRTFRRDSAPVLWARQMLFGRAG